MNLKKQSGLPISLNEEGLLDFAAPLNKVAPSVRLLQDMKEYLADASADFKKKGVYFMYRGVHLPKDKDSLAKYHLRYDLTVFRSGLIGREFIKTIGHFHPKKPGTKFSFPEVYEVISGQAIIIIQKMDDDFKKLKEIYVIETKEREKAIIPPGFGHVTCNVQNQPLVLANWTDDSFESMYEPFKEHHGAALYLMAGENKELEINQNKHYFNIPKFTKILPKNLPHFGLVKEEPMYLTGQKSPDMLQFLINPELYLDQLSLEQCYFL